MGNRVNDFLIQRDLVLIEEFEANDPENKVFQLF